MHQCIIAPLFCLLHFAHFLHLYTSIIVSPRLFHPFHTSSFTLRLKRVMNCLWRSKDRFFFIKFSLPLLVCQAIYMKTVTIHICNLKVHTESWNLPSNFPVLEKILGKSWECFSESYKRNFFLCWPNLIQSHLYVCSTSRKCFFFLRFIKVSIYHLFDNLEYGKRNYCFGKSLEKCLAFWIQKSVWTL